jgi:hypothetical protein
MAPRCRANSLAIVVLPTPGSPPRMINMNGRSSLDHAAFDGASNFA